MSTFKRNLVVCFLAICGFVGCGGEVATSADAVSVEVVPISVKADTISVKTPKVEIPMCDHGLSCPWTAHCFVRDTGMVDIILEKSVDFLTYELDEEQLQSLRRQIEVAIALVYDQSLSDLEILEMREFYMSPTGQKAIRLAPNMAMAVEEKLNAVFWGLLFDEVEEVDDVPNIRHDVH